MSKCNEDYSIRLYAFVKHTNYNKPLFCKQDVKTKLVLLFEAITSRYCLFLTSNKLMPNIAFPLSLNIPTDLTSSNT